MRQCTCGGGGGGGGVIYIAMSLSLCRLSVCTCCDSVLYKMSKMDLMLLPSIIKVVVFSSSSSPY